MSATLNEMIRRLRARLGEVAPEAGRGTWDDNLELQMHVNNAQEAFARDMHTRGEPWSEIVDTIIRVRHRAEYYLMPDNFMVEEKVAHHAPTWGNRELTKGHVQDVRLNIHDNINYTTIYSIYEVRGREAVYVAVGTANVGSNDELLIDDDANFSEVRVGDIVHNLNDESQANVVGFRQGRVELGEWRGGYSQRFYAGEGYRIAARERTADQLWVYPPVSVDDNAVPLADFSAFDTSLPFVLAADVQLVNVDITISELPTDWQEDDVFSFQVRDQDRGDAVVVGSEFAFQKARMGINTVPNFLPFRLRQNTNYNFESTPGVTISGLKFYEESNNYLRVNYTPLPKPLIYDDSVCEFKREFIEPILDYAQMLAEDKIDPDGKLFQKNVNRYEWNTDKARDYRNRAAADHPEFVIGVGDNRTVEQHRTAGYTANFGLVE